jgi:hypothetical protein
MIPGPQKAPQVIFGPSGSSPHLPGVVPLKGDTVTTLSPETQKAFENMCFALEPENLYSDGEASPSEVKKRLKALKTQWKALEKTVGRTVTQEEVWASWTTANETSRKASTPTTAPTIPQEEQE